VRDLAEKRMQEARTAMSLLGVERAHQFFLGYPDGGIKKLLTVNLSKEYHAKFTGETRVPYSDAVFPGHPYTGKSLEQDFVALLDRLEPTLVLAPSVDDTHPDHAASGLLTFALLLSRGELSKVRFWIVHGREGWPSPRGYLPTIPLNTPLMNEKPPGTPFELTEAEETLKLRAVNSYRTQMQFMAPFLLAFVRTTELYSQDPGRLPGPGAP
jgi:LmbE family N-acetylglucosaminyl deacetylase